MSDQERGYAKRASNEAVVTRKEGGYNSRKICTTQKTVRRAILVPQQDFIVNNYEHNRKNKRYKTFTK